MKVMLKTIQFGRLQEIIVCAYLLPNRLIVPFTGINILAMCNNNRFCSIRNARLQALGLLWRLV